MWTLIIYPSKHFGWFFPQPWVAFLYLLLRNQLSQNLVTWNNIYYLSVSLGQKSEHGLASCLWLKFCREVAAVCQGCGLIWRLTWEGPTSKFTYVAISKPWSLTLWVSLQGCFMTRQLASPGVRESNTEYTQGRSLLNLASKVISHHFCYILFIRIKSSPHLTGG